MFLRVSAGTDPVTGRARQLGRTVQAPSQKAAQKELNAFLPEVAAGQTLGTNATVRVVVEEWIRHSAPWGRSGATSLRDRLTAAAGSVLPSDRTLRWWATPVPNLGGHTVPGGGHPR